MAEDTTRAPVQYTVLEKSLIGNKIFEAGEVAEYDGLPAENLQPMCAVGEARYQEYLTSNKARVEAMILANDTTMGVGDPQAFAKALSAALAGAKATQATEIGDAVAAALAQAKTEQAPMIADAVAAALAKAFPNGTAKPAAKATDAPASAPAPDASIA
jgi:hypothetical protein